MLKSAFLLVLIALCCNSLQVHAQSRVKKNDSWLYRVATTDHFFSGERQYVNKVYRITITGVNKDGTTNAQAVLESAAVQTKQINYNTADPSTYRADVATMESMLLLYRPLAFTIYANDSIGVPTNATAIGAVTGELPGLETHGNAAFVAAWKQLPWQLEGLFMAYPEKAEVNYQWKAKEWNYRVTDAERAEIKIAGSQEDHRPDSVRRIINTSYTLSRGKGHVVAYNMENRNVTGYPENSHQVTATLLPADTRIPLADTAFGNALVQLSYNSHSLDSKGELDSAKVAAFLALNVPRYGNNLTFKIALLSLNRSMAPYIREQYNNALNEIPSYALTDQPGAVFNKLQHTAAINVDTAMLLIKLLSADKRSLNGWLDQSFFQYLNSSPFDTTGARKQFVADGLSEKAIRGIFEEAEKMPAASQEIIRRLMLEKDSTLLASVKPMALWNKAVNTTDTAILKNIAAQFSDVSPAEMTMGKAARYELLLYNILRKAKLHKEAATLLDKTLEDLKTNQADTAFWAANDWLKEKKNANKSILAHAYHLKYEATLPVNKNEALGYLALAAAHAPRNKEEQVYESFYDRSFLQAKEDYNPEFAEALTALGKPEEAIKVLSRQLTVRPDMLETTQQLFEQQFPGKSFPDYFRDVLLKEWEQAPDFTLTGLNNESFRLSDYRGKWLLLDFWGTWCGPCRRELPQMNQLAAEMNAGKHPGNAMLAISCGETVETAKDFMAANNYIFPAAHADNQVEKLYKVHGYPTKVLVSPEGKMLDLQFGSDYVAILKMYSNVYSKKDKGIPSTIKIDNKKKD
jgi:thiol-disulfide isomerase/thioredoxin